MALETTAELQAPVNVMVQQTLLRVARTRCPYFLGTMPGELMEHAGTFTVKWRRIDELTPTVTARSELTGSFGLPTRTGTQATATDVTATVAKYGEVIYPTMETQIVNFVPHFAGLITALGIQAGRSLNRLSRNVLEDNATLIRAGGAGSDSAIGDAVSLALMEDATNTIEDLNAIMFTAMTEGSTNVDTKALMPAYWGICHTHVKPDIRKLSGFVHAAQYASQDSIAAGEFGSVGDVRWISTPEASVDADAGSSAGSLRSTAGAQADLYTSVIFGIEAVGTVGLGLTQTKEIYNAGDVLPAIRVINKPMGSAGSGDPFNEVGSLAWLAWWAEAILNADYIRGIRHAANKLQ